MPLSVSNLRGEVGGFEVMLELKFWYPDLELVLSLHTQTEIDGAYGLVTRPQCH